MLHVSKAVDEGVVAKQANRMILEVYLDQRVFTSPLLSRGEGAPELGVYREHNSHD